MFVCLGNICRSCFAEHYARRHYDTAKRFLSAGMIALPGRQSPANAIAAGQETGIDLADHRSMVLTTDMIDTAAALICFDARTEAAVLDRYPEVEHKLFRLDQLGGTAEIADPLDGDMSVFRSCYATIGTVLDRMLGKVQSA